MSSLSTGTVLFYVSLLFRKGMFLFYREVICFSSVHFLDVCISIFWFGHPPFQFRVPSQIMLHSMFDAL